MNKILLGMAGVAALFMASSSIAGMKMTVTDEVGTSSVNDGGSGYVSYDCNPGFGDPDCGLLSGWTVEASSGIGGPLTSGQHLFDLSLDATSSGTPNPATLTVELTETDLSGFGSAYFLSTGQVTSGSGMVSYELFYDETNNGLKTTSLGDVSTGDFMNGSYGDMGIGQSVFGLDDNFSLTLVATLISNQAGTGFSTDTSVNIPEPSVLALFGTGLLGLGLARRRMKK